MDKVIEIKGARVNNLKNVSVNIPRNKITVVTGVSGSGKSSLAFDTLYAEGQRRYVESLSSYARSFLGRIPKPDCDCIRGIPPAIAVGQKVKTGNPRSTVGTSTEIYNYIQLFFARIGRTYSPKTGKEVKCQRVSDVIKSVLQREPSTRIALFAPIVPLSGRTKKQQIEVLQGEGFSRLYLPNRKGEEIVTIEEALQKATTREISKAELLIDRLSCNPENENINRLSDSVETAFWEGRGDCIVRFYPPNGEKEEEHFSNRFEEDGIAFQEPSEEMFNFNNPLGACPKCKGLGRSEGIDEEKVIPNPNLSVYEGAVACWRGEKMGKFKEHFIEQSQKYHFPIHRPYKDLTSEEKKLLFKGDGEMLFGIDQFFEHIVIENLRKIQYRVMLARFRDNNAVCGECLGNRLRSEAYYVKVGSKSIGDLVNMPIDELKEFFLSLPSLLTDTEQEISKRLLQEINNRISFLIKVGLSYLTLNRASNTLSGGESQRIFLASILGGSLVGSLYILDEPSIGLHPRDTEQLIGVLRDIKGLGNTVVVVEHDEEVIRASDYLIDLGPDAGYYGGELIYAGEIQDIFHTTLPKNSHTIDFLKGEEQLPVPFPRRRWNRRIVLSGVHKNNLKNISVSFPLNVITCVTGVSGSGKSTLVRDVLYATYSKRMNLVQCSYGNEESFVEDEMGEQEDMLHGDLSYVGEMLFIDQKSISTSSRSCIATILKAYDGIRSLYVAVAKEQGKLLNLQYFSFNNAYGGRCPKCEGDGVVTIGMQFLADVTLVCEECKGKRFTKEALDILYRGKSIYDVLEMNVDEAIAFFSGEKRPICKSIVSALKPFQEVGLGYIKLGQSTSTLSGGEKQRVKLASYLCENYSEHTFFIFDEPTTGLHFHDIKTLLNVFNKLVECGHTVLIIEHNMDVVKCADYVIDLGPEGGKLGGNVVCCGTPEEIASCPNSYTGKFLKEKLKG